MSVDAKATAYAYALERLAAAATALATRLREPVTPADAAEVGRLIEVYADRKEAVHRALGIWVRANPAIAGREF